MQGPRARRSGVPPRHGERAPRRCRPAAGAESRFKRTRWPRRRRVSRNETTLVRGSALPTPECLSAERSWAVTECSEGNPRSGLTAWRSAATRRERQRICGRQRRRGGTARRPCSARYGSTRRPSARTPSALRSTDFSGHIWDTDWLAVATLKRENPRVCGGFLHSGGGIRTRDLRVMSPTVA